MKRSRLLAGAITFVAVLGAATSPAHADRVAADGDNVEPVMSSPLNLGTVCAGTPTSGQALLALVRTGDRPGEVFADGSTVTINTTPGAGDSETSSPGLSATVAGPITLPAGWGAMPTGTRSDAVSSTVTLQTTVLGPYVGEVRYYARGVRASGGTIVRNGRLAVLANVVTCSPPPMPTTKDDCKKGGWRSYGVFKNQGDCVSFVATGGRNAPAGA